MSKKRRPPRKSSKTRPPRSAEAMRSMIRLALSLRGPENELETRIRSALDAFGKVTSFDAWMVGTISYSVESPASPSFEFAQLLCGGADPEQVASMRRRWTNHLKRNVAALQPLVSVMTDEKPLSEPLVRLWQDGIERVLLSIWPRPAQPTFSQHAATWISLHRIGKNAARFQLRERRWLTLLHSQCATVMPMDE